MFGKKHEPTETHDADVIAIDRAKQGEKGTTYALYRPVMEEGGTEQLVRVGTVFLRGSMSGGLVFLTGDDGRKYELPMMVVAETRTRKDKVSAALSARHQTVALRRPAK